MLGLQEPTSERLVKKIEDAGSQELIVLGASQTYDLNSQDTDEVCAALRKRQRLGPIEVKNVSFSPSDTEGFFRTCLEHNGISEVKLLLFRSVRSSSQKYPMRMIEDFPDEVETYINNHPDTMSFKYFGLLNSKILKVSSVVTIDDVQVPVETQCTLPLALLEKHIRPFLTPKKKFEFGV